MVEFFDAMTIGFQNVLTLQGVLFLLAGVVLGVAAGALPGLSPSTAVALFVPFSYAMDPAIALIFLTSIYISSNYGGSITAVLINTPGTPSAAVTAFDGFELTRLKQAHRALGISLWASTIGGTLGVGVLILFAVPLAGWAILMSSADYFALAIMGLTTVGSLSSKSPLKSMSAVVMGLFLATIGIDTISGVSRFTMNYDELEDGVKLIPALIGLFAVSTVFEKMINNSWASRAADIGKSQMLKLKDVIECRWTIVRSSMIGTILGIFPGAGATIAAFISYDMAKKRVKNPKPEFGKGNIHGVASAEAANSSSVGGALVPLLALGIPGSATDAVLLGAFMLHDLNPGPLLFKESPEIPYGIFAGLLLANLAILVIGLFGNRLFLKITKVPEKVLFPLILMFAVIGSYTVNLAMVDVWFCMGFGLLGYVMKKAGFPVAPVVLGLVLGDMIEENFRRAVIADGWNVFYEDKLCLAFLVLSAISLGKPVVDRLRKSSATH